MTDTIDYLQSLDTDRNKRWIVSSGKFEIYDPFIVVTIQGLGKLDSKLIVEDNKITKDGKPSNPFGDIGDHLTLSYLWVLGSYEVVRSLDQRARKDTKFFPTYAKNIKSLKIEFERLRMPLAKFEPANRFSETDNHIAYPAIHKELGVSWQVSESTFISRRELSDNMLGLFEELENKIN